ncbi:MAG: hypothetical protein KDB61_07380 [Planctomycetes bacterium]|nr:hypothetical protein [Planctomycetota bacterium]
MVELEEVFQARVELARRDDRQDPVLGRRILRCRRTFFLLDWVFLFRTLHAGDGDETRGARFRRGMAGAGLPHNPLLLAMVNAIEAEELKTLQIHLGTRVHRRWLAWRRAEEWPTLNVDKPLFSDSTSAREGAQKLATLGNCVAEVFRTFHGVPQGELATTGQAETDFRAMRRTILYFASGIARVSVGQCAFEFQPEESTIMNGEPNGEAFLTFAEFGDLLLSRNPDGLTERARETWEHMIPALILGIDPFTRCFGGFSAAAGGAGPLRTTGSSVLQESLDGGRDPRPLPIEIERMLEFLDDQHRDAAPHAPHRYHPYADFYPMWGLLLAKQRLHMRY